MIKYNFTLLVGPLTHLVRLDDLNTQRPLQGAFSLTVKQNQTLLHPIQRDIYESLNDEYEHFETLCIKTIET